jgi:hypothetical protein
MRWQNLLAAVEMAFARTLASLSLPSFAAQEGKLARPRYNVIVLVVDDLGHECLGADGSKTFQTPVADRPSCEQFRLAVGPATRRTL